MKRLDVKYAEGTRFGRWTIVGESRVRPDTHQRYYPCRCDCGRLKEVWAPDLRTGGSRQCKSCAVSAKNRTHGRSDSAEYRIYKHMIARCHCPSDKGFPNYGGRGVIVCGRWRSSFLWFLADMGPRPDTRLSIDRIDNNGDYEPGNCRWATPTEQGRNKRNNRRLLVLGEERTLPEWADRVGLSQAAIRARLNLGWSAADAVNRPLRWRRSCG